MTARAARRRLRPLLAVLVLPGTLTVAGGPLAAPAQAVAPAPSAPPAAAATAVVATLDGQPVLRGEVEARILAQLLAQQPKLLETMLDQVLDEKILAAEAARQKVSRDELVAREVNAKTSAVTDAEVNAFYDERRAQIRAPKEQVAAQIRAYLEQQRRQEGLAKYVAGLRASHRIENRLAQEREAFEGAQAEARRGLIEAVGAGSGTLAFGPADAPVTLVEFTDFQCPFCSRVAPAIERVRKEYADKVRLVLHQLPLNGIHPRAQKAAEAALCAHEQGKFWEMHDLLFGEQDRLEVADLKEKAGRAGLDASSFAGCLDGGAMVDEVAAELALADRLDLHTTPTLYVNGRPIEGENTYEAIARSIDGALGRAGGK